MSKNKSNSFMYRLVPFFKNTVVKKVTTVTGLVTLVVVGAYNTAKIHYIEKQTSVLPTFIAESDKRFSNFEGSLDSFNKNLKENKNDNEIEKEDLVMKLFEELRENPPANEEIEKILKAKETQFTRNAPLCQDILSQIDRRYNNLSENQITNIEEINEYIVSFWILCNENRLKTLR